MDRNTDRENEIVRRIGSLDKMIFLVAQTEKYRILYSQSESRIDELKFRLSDDIEKRNGLVFESCRSIEAKMNEVMVDGMKAVFVFGDDGLFIGTSSDASGGCTPYRGLSGGERVAFDVALAHAIGPGSVFVIEAAEMDMENLASLMNKLAKQETQVLLNTWAMQESVPEGWMVVDVNKQ
jgi:hypothetical protein